jgi:hypothetical protein
MLFHGTLLDGQRRPVKKGGLGGVSDPKLPGATEQCSVRVDNEVTRISNCIMVTPPFIVAT